MAACFSTEEQKTLKKRKSFSFIVNIKDTLDCLVMKEFPVKNFPVKCLSSPQKFVKSLVLCDLIL